MIEKLSSQYEVGSDAIALRFVMDRLKPTVVLSGASSKQQLESNLKANHFELESNEIKSLANFNIDPDLYWFERKQLPWN